MKTNDIVNEIAHLMRVREVGLKDPKEIKSEKGISKAHDEVTLTASAKAFAKSDATATELEKEQFLKVERLKSLVATGNYKLDDEMVESIAERIANTLI